MPGLGALLPGVAATALAAAALTWAWVGFAARLRIGDEPGQRRLHQVRTPRSGGFPLLLAWLLGLAFASGFVGDALPGPMAWLLAISSLFALCGLVDDFLALPALLKLCLQVAIAALAFALAWPGLPAFSLAQALLFGLALVTFVNFWNFMDGSNGMIGWQSLLVALALALWPGQAPWLRAAGLGLAAACAGFLPFNFPKARVFLGDAGSLGLGAAVFLMLLLSCRAGVMAPWQAALLCTPMLLDATLTLARRLLRGRRFWRAHREHLYQYAVRIGHSHAGVALAYAAATLLAWVLALAIAATGNQSPAHGLLLLGVVWCAGAIAYVGLRRRWLRRRMHHGGRG